MAQSLDTQEARSARIREITSWDTGDYERFAATPVERQLSVIEANEARIARQNAEAQRPANSRPAAQMVECACGHSVPRHAVMSASLGSSCPDCYDRMSH